MRITSVNRILVTLLGPSLSVAQYTDYDYDYGSSDVSAINEQAFTLVLEVADIQGVNSVRTFCISAPDGHFCQKFGALFIWP